MTQFIYMITRILRLEIIIQSGYIYISIQLIKLITIFLKILGLKIVPLSIIVHCISKNFRSRFLDIVAYSIYTPNHFFTIILTILGLKIVAQLTTFHNTSVNSRSRHSGTIRLYD